MILAGYYCCLRGQDPGADVHAATGGDLPVAAVADGGGRGGVLPLPALSHLTSTGGLP